MGRVRRCATVGDGGGGGGAKQQQQQQQQQQHQGRGQRGRRQLHHAQQKPLRSSIPPDVGACSSSISKKESVRIVVGRDGRVPTTAAETCSAFQRESFRVGRNAPKTRSTPERESICGGDGRSRSRFKAKAKAKAQPVRKRRLSAPLRGVIFSSTYLPARLGYQRMMTRLESGVGKSGNEGTKLAALPHRPHEVW